MTSDCVERQSRSILLLSGDRTIRNKSELDQRLEAVADTERQSVTLIQQLLYCLLQLRIPKCRCKEFCRAIRLIACGKSAREHDDLCLTDCLLKCIYRLTDRFCA